MIMPPVARAHASSWPRRSPVSTRPVGNWCAGITSGVADEVVDDQAVLVERLRLQRQSVRDDALAQDLLPRVLNRDADRAARAHDPQHEVDALARFLGNEGLVRVGDHAAGATETIGQHLARR